jgi:hypothetical protein
VTTEGGVVATAGEGSSELKLLLLRIDVTGCGAAGNGGGAGEKVIKRGCVQESQWTM